MIRLIFKRYDSRITLVTVSPFVVAITTVTMFLILCQGVLKPFLPKIERDTIGNKFT